MNKEKIQELLKLKIDIQEKEEQLKEDKKQSVIYNFKVRTNAQKISQLKNELVEKI